MKSIKQIFKNNKRLLSNESVIELIDYCYELEEQIIDNNLQSSLENNLTELIKEIYSSINETLKHDEESKRFGEIGEIDYEKSLKNLKKYLQDFSRYNKFEL